MSTYSYFQQGCFCSAVPSTSNNNQPTEKKINRQQLIAIKKELNDSKISENTKHKISLASLKNQRPCSKVQTSQINNNIVYRNSLSQITVGKNHTQQNINLTSNFKQTISGSNIRFIQQNPSQNLEFLYRTTIPSRKINIVQNKRCYDTSNNFQPSHHQILTPISKIQPMTSNFQPCIIRTNVIKYPTNCQKIILQPPKYQQSSLIKYKQQTLSTSPSKQQIYIKQAQSIYGQTQHQLLSPISIRQSQNFPYGIRKAHSLQDNDSQIQQLSFVVDNFLNPQYKQEQAQTERMRSFSKQLHIQKLNQTQRRSTGTGSTLFKI